MSGRDIINHAVALVAAGPRIHVVGDGSLPSSCSQLRPSQVVLISLLRDFGYRSLNPAKAIRNPYAKAIQCE